MTQDPAESSSSIPYAELHCHTNHSFLDGASMAEDLMVRAAELGLTALAATDNDGLYGTVRLVGAVHEVEAWSDAQAHRELDARRAADPDGVADATGVACTLPLRPVLGTEIELGDAAVADPDAVVLPPRRPRRRPGAQASPERPLARDGLPARPRPERARLPGYREVVREDLRGVGARARGPRLVLLARDITGWTSLTRLLSAGNMSGSKGAPRFDHVLLEQHHERVVALSGGRSGEIGRRLLVGDRVGARAAAGRLAAILGHDSLVIELTHHLLPDDDWLIAESVRLARELRLPVVVTNAVRYAHPWGRELQDVLTAIRHGRTLDTLADLRRPSGEAYLKSGAELAALGASLEPEAARAWREGIDRSVELAAACQVSLDFEQSRFPGYRPPDGLTPNEYLWRLCRQGLHERYRSGTPEEKALSRQAEERLERELGVIERKDLAEFFLICWDVMRFAREQRIPAHGRGSAAGSIVTYVLYISRVEPIHHDLLFERFISEERTVFPDVDIDFSSERREEVIQYVYGKYGPEHTGMVANLVTYRARSAVRDVGHALGFPRPLVDRVAKALETYDPVRVRDDLQADGTFADLFRTPDGLGSIGTGGSAGSAGSARAAAGPDQVAHARIPPARVPPPGRAALAGDKGGPGDSPTSIALLQGARQAGPRGRSRPPSERLPQDGWVPSHPETGNPLAPPRRVDHAVRPDEWATPTPVADAFERTGRVLGDGLRDAEGLAREADAEAAAAPSEPRGGSTTGLSPWQRWLELSARLDSFPRHLSIHSGGMLITRRPLVDIVPIERATMPYRVVVQFDKRDVEALGLIKLDLLGLGMLGAIDKTLRLIERDCGQRPDLDALPEDIPEVFEMVGAADTVGVFQIESRAQMQTLPKSRPTNLDDLVVEVAIIRPGPIQGNAVHPYLRRRQGQEEVTYLHPDLEPILRDSLGVILYQEQVMRISMAIAGFSGKESDQFRRAMGAWRVTGEMERFRDDFVQGAMTRAGLDREQAEELFDQCAAFANFGFAKSHAAAFARTAYESAFLKLFYPAQTLVGLIDTQPMGFYPTEVLVNDTKRHGVAVLPVDINASGYRTATEWVGEAAQPPVVVSSACVVPSAEARGRWALPGASGWGVRLGLHLVKGVGEREEETLDRARERGPYRTLVDVVERTDLSAEVIERLIRAGALDSLGRPRRELLWQLPEVAGRSGRTTRRAAGGGGRAASRTGRRTGGAWRGGRAAGRPLDLRLPATEAPPLPAITETERLGDAYAILGVDAQRHAVSLFRPALEQLGAVTNASLADRPPGWVRVGGLVVTRQHPMTARGTVFLALEDETGMVNVTLWPATWARLRPVVRRHALLLVEGELQRDGLVVNLVAHAVHPLPEVAGVRQMGFAGMRRLG